MINMLETENTKEEGMVMDLSIEIEGTETSITELKEYIQRGKKKNESNEVMWIKKLIESIYSRDMSKILGINIDIIKESDKTQFIFIYS